MENQDQVMLEARRRFLTTCGKFAVATPPAITLLMSSSAGNYAIAASGFGPFKQGNNGFGNGGGDGVPGNSGNNPSPNSGEKNEDQDR